jgi:signal transduction histidine kinase
MEKTRPEFPGVFALGLELPVSPEAAEVFRKARASREAAHFGPGSELAVPARLAERFKIQSMIVMAVYPKWDKPYLFGLHQCAYPRTWTTQEQRLFEEIGRRLADALSSLLMFRSLRESEARLEEASRLAHVGYWERDIEAKLLTWSLAAVLTNANASLRWLAGDSPNLDETREAIRRVMRDGKRATEIISRIRALARKALPQPGWLDLNQAIWEITAMLRDELHRSRVSLQTQLATDLPALWGDRIQLQQVLLNLLMNGIEALRGMDEGPRDLMVSSEKSTEPSSGSAEGTPETTTSAGPAGPHVLVTVRDTGPGLDPRGLERLFEAFYTTKP